MSYASRLLQRFCSGTGVRDGSSVLGLGNSRARLYHGGHEVHGGNLPVRVEGSELRAIFLFESRIANYKLQVTNEVTTIRTLSACGRGWFCQCPAGARPAFCLR